MTETESTPRARHLPPRDARGRFVARPGAMPKTVRVAPAAPCDASGRVCALPSRDARGRFVAFPTTEAPSWYVFCADGYRIPGHTEVMAMAVDAQPQPLPPARVMRRRRPAMQWDEIATWILIAIFVIVVGWHMLHLQPPHR
jgi:hypothetical protein